MGRARRRWAVGLAVGMVAGLAACRGESRGSGGRSGSASAARDAPGGDHVAPVAPVVTIRPVVTEHAVTLAVGARPGWVELNAGCYFDGCRKLGRDPLELIEPGLPGLGRALAANNFDLQIDLLSVGLMKCGDLMCVHAGVRLDSLDQGRALVRAIFGLLGFEGEELDAGRVRFTVPSEQAGGYDVSLLAIDWDGVALPDEYRAHPYGRATHLMLVQVGRFDRLSAPADLLATPASARPRVEAIERLVSDPRGRCAMAEVGAIDGLDRNFDLRELRAIAVTPPVSGPDPLALAFGADRSIVIEVDLGLSPTPTDADVERWSRVRARTRGEAAGAAPGVVQAVLAMIDAGGHLEIGDERLHATWRSSDVPAAVANTLMAELERSWSR